MASWGWHGSCRKRETSPPRAAAAAEGKGQSEDSRRCTKGSETLQGEYREERGGRRNHPQGRGFCNGAALGAFGKRKEVGSRGCQPIPGCFGNLQSPALGLAVLVKLNFASARFSEALEVTALELPW